MSSNSVLTEASYSVKLSKQKGEKIGVSFRQLSSGAIAIAKIKEQGMAAKTDMKEGHTIVSINGKSLEGMDSSTAAKALRDTSGDVDILLENDPQEPVLVDPPETAPADVVAVEGEANEKSSEAFNCWSCIVQ
jgi:membrane-associated protease RseP (regulator of RpoE activity)